MILAFRVPLALLLLALPAAAETATGRVVGITDGDTVRVLHDGQAVKIRMHGIDDPESRQPFGTKSKTFLSGAIAGKTVTVIDHGTDRYGRTIGEIICDGVNVNHESVDVGMAWWYRQYAKDDSELAAAEQRAKAAKRGLWADPKPIPPWEWRKGGSAAAVSAAPVPPPVFGSGSHWLTDSSKKRHNSTCRYSKKTKGRPCGSSEGTACKLCGG